jgi:dUTP pyrophosphatase
MNNKYILRIIPNNDEIGELYKNHGYYNIGDSGIDIYNTEDVLIKKGETKKIVFGISCEIIEVDKNDNYIRNISYWVLPRSSIVKTPLRLGNSIGLIDAHYQGNICAFTDNIKDYDYIVKKGTRLFQIATPDLTPISEIKVVERFLDSSKNRGGGYGSTSHLK